MDNPQYYQPLSHALDPPRSTHFPSSTRTYSSEHTATTSNHRPEQHDRDESDDEVEEQLARNDHSSDPASPQLKASASENQGQQSSQAQQSQSETETKRRPGRPRGSKNRRGRPSTAQQTPVTSHPPLHPTGQGTNPPQISEVNAQNKDYYEFQWRVLNLCAEFYGAAEQLLKAQPSSVIAQCYQMGPGNKFDPLVMLAEAKHNVDNLLANPSKLITSPPPALYPPATSVYVPTATPAPAASSSKPPTVINQPQSFVVPMGYSVYPPPGAYPTTSYYQYPYGQPYYAPPPPANSTPATSSTSVAPNPAVTVTSSGAGAGAGNQGAWSDEEVERFKKLSADARAAGQTGDQEWDWVANQWGNGRTKRQIISKATQLGLKDRGVKRRRENDGKEDGPTSSAPTPAPAAPTNTSTSPTQSQATNTPVASPAIQHQPRPSTAKPPSVSVAPVPVSSMPWPMPTVAASTVSPVLTAATTSEHRTTSYYRPRPSDSSSKPYLYQTNGHGTRDGK